MNFLEWLKSNVNWRTFISQRDIISIEELAKTAPGNYLQLNLLSFYLNEGKNFGQIRLILNCSREELLFYLKLLRKEHSLDEEKKIFNPLEKKDNREGVFSGIPEVLEVIDLPRFYIKEHQKRSFFDNYKGSAIFLASALVLFFGLSKVDYLKTWKKLDAKISSSSLIFNIPQKIPLLHNDEGEGFDFDEGEDLIAKKSQSDYFTKKNRMRGISPYSKSYRIILNSIDLNKSKRFLQEMISKHEAKQADKVEPGTRIPGGLYFNLYLKDRRVKKFLRELKSKEEGKIYSGRSQQNLPRGMSRVFIWVKGV